MRKECEDYFKYLNSEHNEIKKIHTFFKKMYNLDKMSNALVYTHVSGFEDLYKIEPTDQNKYLSMFNRNPIHYKGRYFKDKISKEYDRFICSFFLLLKYLFWNGLLGAFKYLTV